MSSSINPPFKRPRIVSRNLWAAETQVAVNVDLKTIKVNIHSSPPFIPPTLPPYLIKEFEHLKFKDLLSLAFVCKQFFVFVFGQPHLYNVLILQQNPGLLQNRGLNKFRAFTSLNVLDLSYNKEPRMERQDAIPLKLDTITCLTNLMMLKMNNNEVGSASLQPLTSLGRLTSLHLRDVVGLDQAFDTVLRLTRLNELNISKALLSSEHITSLSQLTYLSILDISKLRRKVPFGGNFRAYVDSFEFLTNLTNLVELNFSSNFEPEDWVIPSLARLTNLTALNISDNEIGDEVVKLSIPPSVKVLKAYGVGISPKMMSVLTRSNQLVILHNL